MAQSGEFVNMLISVVILLILFVLFLMIIKKTYSKNVFSPIQKPNLELHI